MDDVLFSARRASAGAPVKSTEPADPDARFRTLVQSPLRAGILRYLNSRPDTGFDVEALMQTFGRLRLDVENCVRELADFGVARMLLPVLSASENSKNRCSSPHRMMR